MKSKTIIIRKKDVISTIIDGAKVIMERRNSICNDNATSFGLSASSIFKSILGIGIAVPLS
jgi:hypothetical protein